MIRSHGSRLLLACLTTGLLTLAGCASRIDLAQQSDIAKRELKTGTIESMASCSYAFVPYGDTTGIFRAGACFVAEGALFVRAVDATNPELGRFIKLDRGSVDSYSVYRGMLGATQLQLRLKQGLYAVSPSSATLDQIRERTETYARVLQAAGVPEVESRRAITAPVEPTPVYLYESKKKK